MWFTCLEPVRLIRDDLQSSRSSASPNGLDVPLQSCCRHLGENWWCSSASWGERYSIMAEFDSLVFWDNRIASGHPAGLVPAGMSLKWMGTNCFTTSNGMSALSSLTVQIATLHQWGICVPVWNQSDCLEMACSTAHHLHLQRVRMGLSNPVVNNMEGNLPLKRTTTAPGAKD